MKKRPTPVPAGQAPRDSGILLQPGLFGEELAVPTLSEEDDSRPFIGTDNPRHLRVIHALRIQTAVHRKQIDSVAGCSNAPELIAELRRRNLEIPCDRIPVIDRDGKVCHPGLYRLSAGDRRKLGRWLAKRVQK
jgi:hypothetical protein